VVGVGGQAVAQARRPAAHVSLDDPGGLGRLLDTLRAAGAHEQASTLMCRLPAVGMFTLFAEAQTARDQPRFGLEADSGQATQWDWKT
jgi:hypothetical protein